MAKLCQGFLVLPGGIGTAEELWEMCSLTQLGFHKKPVVLLNINGFFEGMRTFLDSYVARRSPPRSAGASALIHRTLLSPLSQ